MHQDTVRVLEGKEKNGGGSVRKAKLLKSWAWHDEGRRYLQKNGIMDLLLCDNQKYAKDNLHRGKNSKGVRDGDKVITANY